MSRLNKISYFLIMAIIVFTTLAYGTVHQPIIVLFYLLVMSGFLLWIADSIKSGSVRFSRSAIQLPLILLGIFAVIQFVPFGTYVDSTGLQTIPRTISVDPFSTQVTALHIFVLVLFFALALVSLDSAGRLRRMATVITIFGFVYAFYAILQSVLSPNKIYGIYGPRDAVPFGSFVNRHNFAALMEMAISVPLGLIFAGAVRADKRLLYLVAIALMATSLLLSGSRGGLVALVSEIILLIILTTRAKGTKAIVLKVALAMLLIGAAVGGAIFVGGDTSLTRFADSAASTDVTSSRTHIWAVTLNVITSNLPLGAGLGAFGQAYTSFDTASGFSRVEQSHNDYLQIVADAGLVGLAIGGLFLFLIFREGFRNAYLTNTFRRGIALGAFAGCFAVLVHSLFDFVLHITAISVMFISLMAMLVASRRKYDDDIEEFDSGATKHRRSASVKSFSDGSGRRRSRPSAD